MPFLACLAVGSSFGLICRKLHQEYRLYLDLFKGSAGSTTVIYMYCNDLDFCRIHAWLLENFFSRILGLF